MENIDANLCTHIAYSFVGLNADGSLKLLDSGSNKSAVVVLTHLILDFEYFQLYSLDS